jgi:hypothetical protein
MTIPFKFTNDGVLAPGDYKATLADIRASILVTGSGVKSQNWDSDWRSQCVDNLEIMVHQLWQIGITRIFIDGSFVEDKDHPNDLDGYFDCDFHRFASGQLETELNLIDQHKVWTWHPSQRRPYRGYPKAQLPMWHTYRVELWPNFGQPFGIRDIAGNSLSFAQAFRISRTNNLPKGIIELIRGSS